MAHNVDVVSTEGHCIFSFKRFFSFSNFKRSLSNFQYFFDNFW